MNNTKTCTHCKSEINKLASKCPNCGGKNYVWTPFRKIMSGFMILVLFFIFFQSGSSSTPATNPIPVDTSNIKTVFDLNSLYGKNIDQIVIVLGKPANDTEPTKLQKENGNITEWEKTFDKDGQKLLVTYNVSTRKVVDFFIDTRDSSGATSDTSSIVKIAGSPSVEKFTIKPVPTIRDKSVYTGVIFTPKN